MFGNHLVSENFQNTMNTSVKTPPQPSTFEVRQMLDMDSIKNKAWADGHKETYVNGLFFFGLQSYLLEISDDLRSQLYVFT